MTQKVDQGFLYNYFDINISPELLRVDGVGDLDILGTRNYAMRVWLHPDKMIAYDYQRMTSVMHLKIRI